MRRTARIRPPLNGVLLAMLVLLGPSSSTMAQSDAVLQAQRALSERGYNPGPTDGLMGPRTSRALRDFQLDMGLDATGVLDQATSEALARDPVTADQGTTSDAEPEREATGHADVPLPAPQPDIEPDPLLTANHSRDSACAIGVALVRQGRLVALERRLIRPPTPDFFFTHVHGIEWEDVRNEPSFAEVWADLHPVFADVDFLAAHNAPFDRSVLHACCETHRLRVPAQPFICTVQMARSVFDIYPTNLPAVCRRLRIPLSHHEAGSDAEACARIVLAAMKHGWRPV